jgi:hypothetical protein
MTTPTPTPPVTPGEKWYSSAQFLSWLFSQAMSLVVLVLSIAGHPVNSNLWQSVASAAALFVAGITTTIFIHTQAVAALQRRALAHELVLAEKGLLPRD